MSWRATHIKKKFGFQVPEVLVSQTKSDLGTLLETSSFKSTKPLHKTTSRDQGFFQKGETEKPKFVLGGPAVLEMLTFMC